MPFALQPFLKSSSPIFSFLLIVSGKIWLIEFNLYIPSPDQYSLFWGIGLFKKTIWGVLNESVPVVEISNRCPK